MTATLRFEDARLVHLDQGTYMWVSVKRFRIEAGGTDQELISALLADRHYRDHYAGQDPEEQNQDELHGPYWLRAINLALFEPETTDAAKRTIQDWVDQAEAQTPETKERLALEVYPLFEGGSLYRLPDLRSSAEHEWGWVVGQGGFYEFVVIDRDAARLFLIVASDD